VTTPEIAGAAKLPLLVPPYQANAGIFIAIVLAVILYVLYRRFVIGYEADILGINRRFAQYGGVRSKRVLLTLFLVSGAVAGLTGAVEVLGAHYRFDSMFPKGLGFDGITVSLLARNAPLGTIPAGLFIGALKNGAFNVERMTNVNRAAINVIQALILLFFTMRIWLPPVRRWLASLKGRVSRA
jgi:simple sugar transport system permease protein